ncbi:hypothetical protein ACBQ88_17155 [Citrobacter braakii]|uniref:hypothetical protein n=1 Tax=Citrobacter braakii TaxID=57706 RepID=UPI0035262DB2
MIQLKNKIITMEDIRSVGGCATGIRTFFKFYNLNFRKFMNEGIAAADLINTGDALAVDVVNKILNNGGDNGE